MGALFIIFWLFSSVLLMTICEVRGTVLTRRSQRAVLLSIFSGLTTITLLIVPSPEMDLYRYYAAIERLRTEGWKYFVSLLSTDVRWIFNYELYLVSRTKWNELAPCAACLVTFSIYIYIYFDYSKREKTSNRFLLISLGLFFAWCPFFQIIDNLKSSMSMSLCSLCIYRQIYKHKSLKSQIALYIIACLTHQQAFIIFSIVVVFTYFKNLYRFRAVLIFIGLLPTVAAQVFGFLPLQYFEILADKVLGYYSGSVEVLAHLYNEYSTTRLIMIIVFAVLQEVIMPKVQDGDDKAFFELSQVLMLFLLGCSFVPEIGRRCVFLFAPFSIIQISVIARELKKNMSRLFMLFLWVMILGMQLWALLKTSKFAVRGFDYSALINFLSQFFDL